jgi:hypothetical protein
MAAELCGAAAGARPAAADGAPLLVSVRILQTRRLALAGAQRKVFAAPLDGAADRRAQLCGLFVLGAPEGAGGATMLLHDPRPSSGFDGPPADALAGPSVVAFRLAAPGALVLYPCSSRFDLKLNAEAADGAAPPPGAADAAHVFLEVSAEVEVGDALDGQQGWLRTPVPPVL